SAYQDVSISRQHAKQLLLFAAERFVGRASAALMFPNLYSLLNKSSSGSGGGSSSSSSMPEAAVEHYITLAKDESPIVKRAMGRSLAKIAEFVPGLELLQTYHAPVLTFLSDPLSDVLRVN